MGLGKVHRFLKMKLLQRIILVWIHCCVVLIFFVVPLYLLAIYPDVPEPFLHFRRTPFPYGVVEAPPSLMSFLMRLVGCGSAIGVGLLMEYRWLSDSRKTAGSEKGQ
jgi:hypothetical protein